MLGGDQGYVATMSEHRPEKLSDETHEAGRRDAMRHGGADRMPTSDEERLAEQHDPDPDTAAHEEEMAERGARQKGEGRIS
jgi:hypothetical protein